MYEDTIKTERLLLRRPNVTDLPVYTKYCASDRSQFSGGPFDSIEAFEKLATMIGHWDLRGFGRFVFTKKDSGEAVGHVGGLQLNPSKPPEMTWTIWDRVNEGKGFAHEASHAYLQHAAKNLGFRSMVALIKQDNLASRKLAERVGGVLNTDAIIPDWFPNSVTYDFVLSDNEVF